MMKNIQLKSILLITIFLCHQCLLAQKYDEYAQKVREEVWKWDLPEFKNYTVPDEYKNESAVILAMHDQIIATGKSKFRVNAALAFGINKELEYSKTYRKLIKINDKVSLDKYSTISFKEERKVKGYMMSSKFKTIVGARIIKPDGTVKNVDVEDEAVEVTEGKKEKVDHKKLAIPDLQVGDILDYFVQDEGHVDTQNIPPMSFVFGDRYPILHYSVHCEIGKNLTAEYRPINGAPDFTESTNEDKDIVLDAEKKNIPKIEGMDRWVSPFREFPMIRMSVLNNTSGDIWKPKTARKKGLYKNVPASTILDDMKSAYGDDRYAGTSDAAKDTKKLVDRYKKENPGFSQGELACYIYDALQFNWDYYGYGDPQGSFIRTLNMFLKYYKVDYKLAFVTSKYGARFDEVANWYDINCMTIADNDKLMFTYNPPFSIAGEVDFDFEGESGVTLSNYKYKGKILQGEQKQFTVPVTDENYNSSLTRLDVNFTDDPMILGISKKTTNRGNLKREYQSNFAIYEKWDEEMRERLGIKKTKLEEMQEKRGDRKYIDDYKSAMEEARKKIKDNFKDEIKQYHDAEPKEIIEYNVEHLGITSQNPDFVATVKYQQEGLVQKAGNNYILNVGKLIGQQLDLKGEDRKRNVDVYMPTARSYEYSIEIKIPDGYSVSDIEKLNQNVNNASASFSVSATLSSNILKIDTKKVYKNAFEPVANWNNLLEMLDNTINFCNQSIVLRKI